MANISVAIMVILAIDYGKRKKDMFLAAVSFLALLFMAFNSDWFNAIIQKKMFYDDIVFTKRTKYQEIVLTRNGDDFRLYLDGSLQFSTSDEYRYHEMLVHPALAIHGNPRSVLVLGGGDGLAVREILKVPSVQAVTLVELDPSMIDLALNNSTISAINSDSLKNSKVHVVAGDAYDFLRNNTFGYDVIIADFPDPHDETVSKLYTVEFFRLVKKSMARNGVFITQSTSPLFAREAFWCINRTMKQVFAKVVPYHVFIPSFGDWGFNLVYDGDISIKDTQAGELKYFNTLTFRSSEIFPPDSDEVKTEINTFNKPVLYKYYLKGWKDSDY